MLQMDGSHGALRTIHEDAPVDPLESPATASATNFRLSLTSTTGSTPPHLRNQPRRIIAPTHRRQRAQPVKRRSCTPTSIPNPGVGTPERPLDNAPTAVSVPTTQDAPPKRARGRPLGSKNKKSLATSPDSKPESTSGTAASRSGVTDAPLKKKRGRPPKDPHPDLEDLEEPLRKRWKA
ncbi:hypothetical protein K466DRAFT_89448 [Polyporus arcularius HHB13444]|uniref:Uncharacterized protein n=1 Tax=Polyporus arcularius HHB13444 TaxID=1314778 RepID=A0A5C3PI78_9APHY|nr:hypothetical protein K466DRAFT_89448 [Polyporus arcularius HHB13444]